jgi:ferritin-like metal-binding protein YciE
MVESATLHDAFLDELKDAYDGEKQLTKALAKLAKAATFPQLREAFESHLEETRTQIDRLERVFEVLDEPAKGQHCDGLAGIIEEGESLIAEDFDDVTMDACLIAAGQRAEHYEVAAYGTLIAWAKAMGYDEIAELLEETLEEEQAADQTLTQLAESEINQQAATRAHAAEEQSESAAGDRETDTVGAPRRRARDRKK